MSFIEKNLQSINETLQTALLSQELATADGLLQRLDPRTKIICFILCLLAINLTHNLAYIALVYVLILIPAALSRIRLGSFMLKIWLFLPFFTGIIAIPALFNIFSPGPAVFTVFSIPEKQLFISVTQNGLRAASFLLMRVATSVSLSVLLVTTTPWTKLLKALEILRIPRMFIVITLMTYRYIFVLLSGLHDMLLAKKSRNVGRPKDPATRRWLAGSLGALFDKTTQLSENVYTAMVSRGYRNRMRILSNFSFTPADGIALTGTIVCIGVLFIVFP